MKLGSIVLGMLAAQAVYAQSWVAASGGTIPSLAVIAGQEAGDVTKLYICRVTDAQGVTQVGKVSAPLGACVYYAGQSIHSSSYQVLTDFSVAWRPASNGTIPSGSYNASASPGGTVYICRAHLESSSQVGQLRAGTPGCQIEYGGTGGYFTSYEVLWTPWVEDSNGGIPSGAVQGGTDSDGTPLYICRGVSNGVTQLGKFRIGFNGCRFGFANGAPFVSVTNYQMLTSFDPAWHSFSSAVPAGEAFYAASSGGQPKYVCRFTIGGTTALTPGQTGGSDAQGQCRVEYGEISKSSNTFEAMTQGGVFSVLPCQYSVSPTAFSVTAPGGIHGITITASCGWVATTSDSSWLTTDKIVGDGNGSFIVQIAANSTAQTRTGTVVVGGQIITVTQAAPCSYAVSPTAISSGAAAASKTVTVTTAAGCAWTATTPTTWVHFVNPTGSGSGTFTANLDANNTGSARGPGIIFLADKTITVSQDGVCSYTVTPTAPADIPQTGGSITFTPTTNPGCTSSVVPPNFATVTLSASPGQFTLNVPANSTYVPLSGQVVIGTGQTINITQAGKPCTITVNPLTNIPNTAGGFSIAVTVPNSSCQWAASFPANAYLHFTTTSGQGNGSIAGTADANPPGGAARSLALTLTSYLASTTTTITQAAGVACSYTAVPGAQPGANGGQLPVTVTTTAGCPVSFSFGGATWISYNGSGTGSGVYNLTIQPNPGYSTRSQQVTVGNATFTVTQPGKSCTITTTTPATVPSSGGAFTIGVTVPDSSCQWTASETSAFLQINPPASGQGNGQITGTVDANSTISARSAGVSFSSYLSNASATVNQNGTTCTYTVAPPAASFTAQGGTQTVTVTTISGCTWSAVAGDPSWITFPSTVSGNGSGSFTFNAAANPSASPRASGVSVGGQVVIVNQAAATCSYALTATDISAPAAGLSSSVNVNATAGCAWTVISPDNWVVITSLLSGSGDGIVSFTVLPNTASFQRVSTLNIAGRGYVVSQLGVTDSQPTPGMTFVALTPCRVMETRPLYNFEGRSGVFGPPFLAAGETRTLTMPSSTVCPIPSAAKAYVVNITLVPRGNVNFVTVWPAGETRPNVWTIRSPDGNIVANSAIVKAGAGGGISVYASDSSDVLIDINGYFTDNPGISNLVYYPLAPCRVIDTRIAYRSPEGPFGAPSMLAQQTRKFRFPATPYCTVPTGAAAYSMTITAVPNGPLQFLTIWPDNTQQPNVSSINSPAGRVLANSVIIPASIDGSIDVFTYNQSDFLVDINGYFAPDDGVNGQLYFPVTQCRASDSTVSGGMYADDTTRTIGIPVASGCSGIPANAKGYAVNVTALPNNSPMPFITAFPSGQSRPNASILNAFEGQIVTNSAIVPAGTNGAIDVYAYRHTNVVVEISGYFGR